MSADDLDMPELDSLAAYLKADTKPGETIQQIPVADLKPNRYQPRKRGKGLSKESIAELAENIAAHGILQNLVVRRVDGHLEILAGERRWRAAQVAGMATVPCIVRDVDDKTARAIAYSENKKREDMETADAVAYVGEMARDYGNAETVLMTSEKKAYVSKCVKIMSIPEIVDFMASGYSRDVDGFYELAKLYELDKHSALTLIDDWDSDPMNRVGLRVQITRKREAIEQAEAAEAAAKAARENAMSGGGLSDPMAAELRAEEREAEGIEGALGDGSGSVFDGNSIDGEREYCGNAGDDGQGTEVEKKPRKGKEEQLSMLPPPRLLSAILDPENGILMMFTDEGEYRYDMTDEGLESLRHALNG